MIYLLTLVLAVAVFAWRTIALGYRDQNVLSTQARREFADLHPPIVPRETNSQSCGYDI